MINNLNVTYLAIENGHIVGRFDTNMDGRPGDRAMGWREFNHPNALLVVTLACEDDSRLVNLPQLEPTL